MSTHTYIVSENIPFSTKALLILLMSAFFCKKPAFKFSYWSISPLGLELWEFSFIRDWPEIRKSEIPPSKFWPISGDWGKLGIPNLARISLIKCYWMVQNARVTAFTVFELLRVIISQIRVKAWNRNISLICWLFLKATINTVKQCKILVLSLMLTLHSFIKLWFCFHFQLWPCIFFSVSCERALMKSCVCMFKFVAKIDSLFFSVFYLNSRVR